MLRIRRYLGMFLCLLMLLGSAVPAAAAQQERTQAIIRDLIAYYFHYRDKAAGEIENQLETLTALDPQQGQLWRQIMGSWAWINEDMTVDTGVVPDGLPADDSLCIVILGFGLKDDGFMKQELIDRLKVAIASAEKYPEAYVLCTGGETAHVPGISEAGQMGNWLLEQGLDKNRLILEDDALSTTENARNSCRILWRDYPQVSSIAIVSSDYHIRWGSACFSAMTLLGAGNQGKPKLEIVGNAGCVTESPDRDTMYSQAWGVSILADVPFDSSYVPPLYMTAETVGTEPMPEPVALPASEPIRAKPIVKEPVVPVLLGLAAVAALVLIPKRKKK